MARLGDMRPRFANAYLFDGHWTDTVKLPQTDITQAPIMSLTNLNNLRFSQFRCSNRASMKPIAASLATFGLHIVGVIGARAQEQMRGVHAGRIIAAVKYAKAFGDCSISPFKGHGVRVTGVARQPKLAVAFRTLARNPDPAAIGVSALINLSPESRLSLHKLGGYVGGCYTFHVIGLLQRLITMPGMCSASPGLSMSNYSTNYLIGGD